MQVPVLIVVWPLCLIFVFHWCFIIRMGVCGCSTLTVDCFAFILFCVPSGRAGQ